MPSATYVIPVWDTITNAWNKVNGSKKTLWGALLFCFAIMVVFSMIHSQFENAVNTLSIIFKIVAGIITYFLQMGLLYMGIQHAGRLPIAFKQVFRVFQAKLAIKMITLYLLQTIIMICIPFLFFIIPDLFNLTAATGEQTASTTIYRVIATLFYVAGAMAFLYITIRMMLSSMIVLDKSVGPWTAIKLSFQATKGNFWRCLSLVVLIFCILAISAIPLGIGLIWTLPFSLICFGLIYQRLLVNLTEEA